MSIIIFSFAEKMLSLWHRTSISGEMLLILWDMNNMLIHCVVLIVGIHLSLEHSLTCKIWLYRTKNCSAVISWSISLKFHYFFSSSSHFLIGGLEVWSVIAIGIILINLAAFLKFCKFLILKNILLFTITNLGIEISGRLDFRQRRFELKSIYIKIIG